MNSQPISSNASDNRWHGGLDDERVHRIWRGVERGLPASSRKTLSPWMGGLVAAAVLLLLAIPLSGLIEISGSQLEQGAILRTDVAPMELSLDEGSELSLSASSTVRLRTNNASRVELELDRGQVACEVSKRPRRRFSVFAGEVEVRVVGTKFAVHRSVENETSKVEVRVERGVVEVWRRGRDQLLRRLLAGQSWSSEERVEAVRGVVPTTRDLGDSPSEAEDSLLKNATEELVSKEVGSASTSEDSVDTASPGASRRGISVDEVADADVPTGRANRVTPADPAQLLFEEANVARRAGDAAQAASVFRRFLKLYSSDPRAGLAAFELGRLEMDSLGRPGRALSAFRRALSLSPGASFREDVLARIARAYARSGQVKACIKARESYERAYPKGVHRSGLRQACPSP